MRQSPEGMTAFVSAYLNRLRLHQIKDADEYLDYLYQRHESSVVDTFLSLLDARNKGGGENFFDFKNQTLALSIDIAHYAADLYQQYLNWFIAANTQLAPKRILDIGCENGIATCFYATLFPESMVYGIDISENAIICARELASQLNLHNVRFDCLDAMELQKSGNEEGYDLITSLCVIQEAAGYFPEVNDESFKGHSGEDELTDSFSQFSSFMALIHSLLCNEASRFICCERFLDTNQIAHFAHTARCAGLSIDWIQSQNIHFRELDVEEQMPVFVILKQDIS